MTTLILDIESDVDVEQLLADISALSGIKNKKRCATGKQAPKSKTRLLIENMERGIARAFERVRFDRESISRLTG